MSIADKYYSIVLSTCFFSNYGKCQCFNAEEYDFDHAEEYWEDLLMKMIKSPYTRQHAAELFASEVCQQMTHQGVAAFIVEYFMCNSINVPDKETLKEQILQKIAHKEDVESWMIREITPMKGDIFLILAFLTSSGLITHTDCGFEYSDYPDVEEKHERRWSIREK